MAGSTVVAHDKSAETQSRNTQCVHVEERSNYECEGSGDEKKRRENEETENDPDSVSSPVYKRRVPVKTNTVGPQDFVLTAANPVYVPRADLGGLSGTKRRAPGGRSA